MREERADDEMNGPRAANTRRYRRLTHWMRLLAGVASRAMAAASGLMSRPMSSTATPRAESPLLDAAQAVAIAAADVENAKGHGERVRGLLSHVSSQWRTGAMPRSSD